MKTQTRGLIADRNVALLILVPVALSIFFSWGRFIAESFDIPHSSEYATVASLLDAGGFDKKSDKLVILPPWSLRPLVELKAFPWISGDQIGDRPLYRYSRLFVLLEPDGEDEFQKLQQRFNHVQSLGRTSTLEVFLINIDGGELATDFTKMLTQSTIFLKKTDGERTDCSRRLPNGFQCNGRQNWQRVTEEYLLVSENGQKVIWTHPPRKGETLIVQYSDVDLGDQLVFRSGHTRKGSKAKAPVEVEILVGQKTVATLSKKPAFHFSADVIDMTAFAGQKSTVEFRFKTTNDSRNHFAFDAYSYREKGAQ